MEDFSTNLACASCGKEYRIALRKMRSNVRSVCPACGHFNVVSEDDAIKAQRLLERLELEEKLQRTA